ncbi:hypothetical protein [Marinobacter sp. SS5-14b]|jgi:hypothetical protein|uniref:hypothetical protein n=1 Tax=Marinobacter sp. SS5-14b TaxID=3050456 RepID=UPI000C646862|nr:hypothetical protein [Marinobacter sp. SS5-14b]MBQ91884.1 hypothetical protein [Marinobacter sp.]|tara:strand:+ start:659 stop:1162 length:504 start_codon:yes stop_codon:yes gene_type:complete
MIQMLVDWMTLMNRQFEGDRQSCAEFSDSFAGYFPQNFLAETYYVVVPKVPMPAYQFLEEAGFTDLYEQNPAGLTLGNTYYVLPTAKNNLRLHIHELVHAAQWKLLGVDSFLHRYRYELERYGYDNMPLEGMAYAVDEHYALGRRPFDVLEFVTRELEGNPGDSSGR